MSAALDLPAGRGLDDVREHDRSRFAGGKLDQPGGHGNNDAHHRGAAELDPLPAIENPATADSAPAGDPNHDAGQRFDDSHREFAGAEGQLPAVPAVTARLADFRLALSAQAVTDLEAMRIASANRLDALHREYGLEGTPEDAEAVELLEEFTRLEKRAVRQLEKRMRAHPLGAWAASQRGIGSKQLARLLAVIGDPYWNPGSIDADTGEVLREPAPRTVYQLNHYCGQHVTDDGTAPRRRRGQKVTWSTDARKRLYLIAVSVMRQPGPYREVYLARRAHTAITHPDWTDGHSHNDGLRITGKRVLRELWRAARTLHAEAGAA